MKHAQHEIKIILLLLVLHCQTITPHYVITSHWLHLRCYKNQDTKNQGFTLFEFPRETTIKHCSDIHKMFKILCVATSQERLLAS